MVTVNKSEPTAEKEIGNEVGSEERVAVETLGMVKSVA